MDSRTGQAVEERLAALRLESARELRSADRPRPNDATPAASRHTPRAFALAALQVGAMIALPFVLYVRAAVYLSQRQGASAWMAVVAAAAITALFVAGIVTWASRRRRGRARTASVARWVAVPLMTIWCAYAAFYIERANAKSETVRAYYGAVHPVLRVALATVILMDKELVITDAKRASADYARMGLPVNSRTLHYDQRDGWVHAVDLRTRGRGELKNRLVQGYFEIMGFSTLRHVGTADHLHVQLSKR